MSDNCPETNHQEWLSLQGNSIVNVQQGHWQADTVIAGDAQNSFDPGDPYAINAPYPPHLMFFGPHSSNSGPFSHSMASQSTIMGNFLSGENNPSTGVFASPSVGPSLSGQQGFGTYFPSINNQSLTPLDSDIDVSMPGPQGVVAGQTSVLPYVQQRNQPERPLPKGADGYVKIEAAWGRLLRKPALSTDDFDALFFPPDQAAEPLDDGGRRCRIKASVAKNGPAKWIPFDEPCGHTLKSADSYRRHVITQHLSCARGATAKQDHCILERWFDAVGPDPHSI